MSKIILRIIVSVVDHTIFLFTFPICLVVFLFAIPWIMKQRSVWQNSVRGSHNALILLSISVEKAKTRGYEHLTLFRNPSLKWIGVLDPANTLKTKIKLTDNLDLMTWKSPVICKILKNLGFAATSIIIREPIAIFKITRYCVREKIGLLRAFKHDYSALQAFLVSSFIKIPFMVDIIGNYELIQRLSGRTFYFRKLNKVPVFRVFARILTNWLHGLPLRKANRVLGRNKNNYEHAFALGAPVDRLSLLRINNFNSSYDSYNPEHPPASPVEFPYILYVGRLAKVKYPLDVIDAFSIAAPQLPECRLVIIGDGKLRNDVEHRIECSRYKDRIVLMGACSNDTVFNWTAHAKVAMCPYSGATLVEAMLCGIPVIAYDVEWHAEIVIDDYTGYLVPFMSVEAFAQKLIQVVHNYDDAKKVGMRGRDLARIVFDQNKICQKESLFYRQALSDT